MEDSGGFTFNYGGADSANYSTQYGMAPSFDATTTPQYNVQTATHITTNQTTGTANVTQTRTNETPAANQNVAKYFFPFFVLMWFGITGFISYLGFSNGIFIVGILAAGFSPLAVCIFICVYLKKGQGTQLQQGTPTIIHSPPTSDFPQTTLHQPPPQFGFSPQVIPPPQTTSYPGGFQNQNVPVGSSYAYPPPTISMGINLPPAYNEIVKGNSQPVN